MVGIFGCPAGGFAPVFRPRHQTHGIGLLTAADLSSDSASADGAFSTRPVLRGRDLRRVPNRPNHSPQFGPRPKHAPLDPADSCSVRRLSALVWRPPPARCASGPRSAQRAAATAWWRPMFDRVWPAFDHIWPAAFDHIWLAFDHIWPAAFDHIWPAFDHGSTAAAGGRVFGSLPRPPGNRHLGSSHPWHPARRRWRHAT